jgi:DNA repair ATPase RecN
LIKFFKSNHSHPSVDENMTKGTPWTVEEEIELKKLIDSKLSLQVIASTLKRTPSAILLKCQRLGLVPTDYVTRNTLALPEELPSVEDTLKELAAALKAAKEPGLNKVEVQRLQAIATLARTYKEILADYINYREIENKLNDMEEKYAALIQTTSQNNAPQPDTTQVPKGPA